MPLRDLELHHAEAWIQAVEATRQALAVSPAWSTGVDTDVTPQRCDAVATALRGAYRALVARTGLADRYEEYFAACVVSHFGAADPHQMPSWLRERLRRARMADHPLPAGMIRLEFYHAPALDWSPTVDTVPALVRVSPGSVSVGLPPDGVPGDGGVIPLSIGDSIGFEVRPQADPHDTGGTVIQAGTTQQVPLHNLRADYTSADWVPVPLPYGVEVLWPYQVPMLSVDADDLERLRHDVGLQGVVSTWVVMDRQVAFHQGRARVLPFRIVAGAPRPPLTTVFGLPADAVLGTFPAPAPFLNDGAGAVHVYTLDDTTPRARPWTFRHLGDLRPIAPHVSADANLPNDEQAWVRYWKRFVPTVSMHPAFRPGRGAPPRHPRIPGLRAYSGLVRSLYTDALIRWGDTQRQERAERGEAGSPVGAPNAPTRQRLWDSAKRTARNHVPDKTQRDAIPAALKAAVEATEPWATPRHSDS